MKSLVWILLVLICATPFAGAAPHAGLAAGFSRTGLSSLHDGGTELLLNGQPRVEFVLIEDKMRDAKGLADVGDYHFERRAEAPIRTAFDRAKKLLSQDYSWGTASYAYRPGPGRIDVSVTLTNKTQKTLADIAIALAGLKFPSKPTGLEAAQDGMKSSLDNLALSVLRFGDRQLLLCNLTMDPPVHLGFDAATDTAGLDYTIRMAGGVQAVQASAYEIPPHGQPRIAPGKSLTLVVTLRTADAAMSSDEMLKDVYAQFAADYRSVRTWKDRRPIGMIMLPSRGHISDGNPRGWFGDQKLDVRTKDGMAEFNRQMLAYADQSVKELKSTGAQGMIVWNMEGEEIPQPISYIGDPRLMKKLAPEMDEIADQFFEKFTDAGLSVGCCIRPTQVYYDTAKQKWDHGTGSDGLQGRGYDYEKIKPADLPCWRFYPIVDRISDKIAYAKQRWGCTIFYIDTNGIYRPLGEKGNFDWLLLNSVIWKQIQARHPDVLLIPELVKDKWAYHAANWAYTASYMELDMAGYGTPTDVRAMLPGAFSLVNINDGPIEDKRSLLVDAVRKGDILMFRGWFGDSRNAIVKSIYDEAAKR